MLKIVHFPDPILREKMPEFDFGNPAIDPIQLEKDMLEIMYQNHGMGLAANQVGIRARVFVMGHESAPELAQAFFNPIIEANTDQYIDLIEGCLSFPDMFVKVKRPNAIKARWQNRSGEWESGEFNGYDCKCFLHEFDHLEGIVFQDRISKLKWSLASKNKKIYKGRK
jgi:peptide deformylase